MATALKGSLFPDPTKAHPDGPMRWHKFCSRYHRTGEACPGMHVSIQSVGEGKPVAFTKRFYRHEHPFIPREAR